MTGVKKYFYSDGQEKFGPFTKDELHSLKLDKKTLIWFDGLPDWCKIEDLDELADLLKTEAAPPPLPKSKNTVNAEIKGSVEVKPDKSLVFFKPSKQGFGFFLIWLSVHLFALVTSYTNLDFSSKWGWENYNFWPFVKFVHCEAIWTPVGPQGQVGSRQIKTGEDCEFFGVFRGYDLTEFFTYVFGYILIALIYKTLIKKR